MSVRRRVSLVFLGVLFLIAISVAAFWLRLDRNRILGDFLIRNDRPETADLIVVLGGDFWGSRVLSGAELVKKGYAPAALISGPPYRFSPQSEYVPESDLAIQFLVQKGYSPSWFISYPNTARATIDEVGLLLKELKRRHARKFLVVTSNYHSRRAGLVFRMLCLTCEFRVIAAPEDGFNPELDRGFDRIYQELPKLLATPFACFWHRLISLS
jgi:uncharacterized SAM-binding protein YcdF (DUF218 family)